jgi:hypothetical protein
MKYHILSLFLFRVGIFNNCSAYHSINHSLLSPCSSAMSMGCARDPALKGLGTEIYKDVSTDISEKVG